MKAEIKSKRVRAIIEELKDQYMEADKNCRPWIIGFSGGKDSTVTSHLVRTALGSNDILHVFGDTTFH